MHRGVPTRHINLPCRDKLYTVLHERKPSSAVWSALRAEGRGPDPQTTKCLRVFKARRNSNVTALPSNCWGDEN